MSLITPDFGLLFWMTLIFGIVFFILAKFGFPVLTDMVRKRQERIEKSIEDAREIEARMASWKVEQAQMLEAEADKILAEAKLQIAAEKESALRDVRKEVALLSVQVAEKVLRHELSDDGNQRAFIDELVDEASKAQMHS